MLLQYALPLLSSAAASATGICFSEVITLLYETVISSHGKDANLHVPPVLPAHLKQGIGDLTQ